MLRPARYIVIGAAAAVVIGVLTPGVSAGPVAHPAAETGGAAVTSTLTVVAGGLNAPRGLMVDGNRILIAEAGVVAGNTGPCGFAERGLPMCLGPTGSIFEYRLDTGATQRVVTGLPSTALQGGPTVVIGAHDVTMRGDKLIVAFGLLGNKPYRDSLGPGAAFLGQIVSINPTGKLESRGDIVAFEDQLHPNHIEADPFAVLSGPHGFIVVNSGGPGTNRGNDLLAVSSSGTITQLAQFPEHPTVTDPSIMIRSVPTTVSIGPDGAYYVGELSGDPFLPGEARIWRVVPGQPATVHLTGFTTIIDSAFDSQGRLIVLQTSNNPFDVTEDGTLIRVEHNGDRTVLASTGLANPGGVVLTDDCTFYVTTRLASGGGVGELVKVTTC